MKKSLTFMRALLNRFHQGSLSEVLNPLPSEEAEEILNLNIDSQNPEAFFDSPEKIVLEFHYSWLVPKLKEVEKTLQPFILGALPKNEHQKISKLTGVEIAPVENSVAKNFLLSLFVPHLEVESHLPKELLPSSPLAPLLSLERKRFVYLIDLLGLYDLAEKIRNIVDKKRLGSIIQCLSPSKQKFLQYCLKQSERAQVAELNLANWDGTPQHLEKKLHKSGLLRLGKAISGSDPSFIWYLCHQLDSGRGTILQKCTHKQPIEQITPILTEQVVQIIELLTPKRRHES